MPAQSRVFNTRTPLGCVVAYDVQVCSPYACKYKHAHRQPKHACTPCTPCLPILQSLASSPGCQPQWRALWLEVSSSKAPRRLRSRPACLPACLPACCLLPAARLTVWLPGCRLTYLPTYLPTFTESNNHHHLDHTILYWLSGLPNMACLAGTALLVIASTVAVFVASNTQ